MKSSNGNKAVAGRDKDGKAAKANVKITKSNDWLVTSASRLKMVHHSSSRESEWTQDFHEIEPEGVLNLVTCKRPFDPTFIVSVARDADGQCGFDVTEQTLAVANVASRLASSSPMMDGDIIIKVNNVWVGSFREFQAAINSEAEFTLSLRPCQEGHAGCETWDGKGWMLVEFTQAEVIAPEDAASVRVIVRRAGDTHLRLEWGWSIRNRTVPNKFFQKLQPRGTLVFEEGMAHTSMQVEVPFDPTWNAEAVYSIELDPTPRSVPSNVKTMLGNQSTMTLYSINQNSFPSGIYGKIGELVERQPQLLETVWGFWMHNYDEIPFATKMGIILSLLPPLVYYFKQLTWEVLIDCALVELHQDKKCMIWGRIDISSVAKSPVGVLWRVVVARLIFAVLEHIINVRFRMLRLGGQATMKLRANIFTTMIQLSDEAAESFDEGDICKVLIDEARHAIVAVWMQAFQLLQITAGLCVKTVMLITVARKLPVPAALKLFFTFPLMLICMLIALRLRKDGEHKRHHQAFAADENWNAFLTMCNQCRPVILTYKKGWLFTEQFNELHRAFNGKDYAANAMSSDTVWMVQYVFVAVAAGVVLLGGLAVQSEDILVGAFFILIKAVEGFGKDLHSVAQILNGFISGSAAVNKIAGVLNAVTRRQAKVAGHGLIYCEVMDEGQIILEEVSYCYPNMQAGARKPVPKMNLSIPTGSFVCFSENTGEFRFNTLFGIMSGNLLPQTGTVLIPRQLRIVYVPVVPIMFDGTLMYNLMLGDRNMFGDWKTTRETVWNTCKALGMSPELLQLDDYDVGSSGCFLKFRDMVVVSIARALTHHVDLLLISSALDVLGESRGLKVLRYLRKYTDHGGLPEDQLPQAVRRRRTVVYTSMYRIFQEQAEHHVVVGHLETDKKTASGSSVSVAANRCQRSLARWACGAQSGPAVRANRLCSWREATVTSLGRRTVGLEGHVPAEAKYTQDGRKA